MSQNQQKLQFDARNKLLAFQTAWKEKIDKDIAFLQKEEIKLNKIDIVTEIQAHRQLAEHNKKQAELDQRVRYFIMQYGGKEAFEQIAGRTIYQVKEDFRKSIKEGKLAKDMRAKIIENVKITPNEVRDYYQKKLRLKESLGKCLEQQHAEQSL